MDRADFERSQRLLAAGLLPSAHLSGLSPGALFSPPLADPATPLGSTYARPSVADLPGSAASAMSSLAQLQGRYLPPSLPLHSPGPNYSHLMGPYLGVPSPSGQSPTAVAAAEQYKSLLPYWTAGHPHTTSDDSPSALSSLPGLAAHYGSVGSGMYPPYMSVLTNSNSSGVVVDVPSSLLSHGGLNSPHPQHNATLHERRIYELHKDAVLLQGGPPVVRTTTPSPATSMNLRQTPGLVGKERDPSPSPSRSNGLPSSTASHSAEHLKDGRRSTSRTGSADRHQERRHSSEPIKGKKHETSRDEKKSTASVKDYSSTPVKVENTCGFNADKTDASCVVDQKGDANITIKHSPDVADMRSLALLSQNERKKSRHKSDGSGGSSEASPNKESECKSSSKTLNDETWREKRDLSESLSEKESDRARKSSSPEKSSSPNGKGSGASEKLESIPHKTLKSEPIWSPIDIGVKQDSAQTTAKDLSSKKSPLLSGKERISRSATPSLTATTTTCRDMSKSPAPTNVNGPGSVSVYSPARLAINSDKHGPSDSKEATVAVSSPEGSAHYYHYTVSPSHTETKTRKVHATTFTPEVGTLPSVTLSTHTLTNSCGASAEGSNSTAGGPKRESRRGKYVINDVYSGLSPRGSVSSSPSSASDTSSNSSPPTVRKGGKAEASKAHGGSRTSAREPPQKPASKRSPGFQEPGKCSASDTTLKSDNSPKERGKLRASSGHAGKYAAADAGKSSPPKPADKPNSGPKPPAQSQQYMLRMDPRVLSMCTEEERKKLMQTKWAGPSTNGRGGGLQATNGETTPSDVSRSPDRKVVNGGSTAGTVTGADKTPNRAEDLTRVRDSSDRSRTTVVSESIKGKVNGERGTEVYTVSATHMTTGGSVIKQEDTSMPSGQKGAAKLATVGSIHPVNPNVKKSAGSKSDTKPSAETTSNSKNITEESLPSTSSAIPVGIAIARQRTADKKPAQTGDSGSEPAGPDTDAQPISQSLRYRGANSRPAAGTSSTRERDTRDSSRNGQEPSERSSGLTSNLIVTGGDSSDPNFARRGAMTRTLPPTGWMPSTPHMAPPLWMGLPPGSLPNAAVDSRISVTTPPGYQLVRDPVTGQLFYMPADWGASTYPSLGALDLSQSSSERSGRGKSAEGVPKDMKSESMDARSSHTSTVTTTTTTSSTASSTGKTLTSSTVRSDRATNGRAASAGLKEEAASGGKSGSSGSSQESGHVPIPLAAPHHGAISLGAYPHPHLRYYYDSSLVSSWKPMPAVGSGNIPRSRASSVQSRGTSPISLPPVPPPAGEGSGTPARTPASVSTTSVSTSPVAELLLCNRKEMSIQTCEEETSTKPDSDKDSKPVTKETAEAGAQVCMSDEEMDDCQGSPDISFSDHDHDDVMDDVTPETSYNESALLSITQLLEAAEAQEDTDGAEQCDKSNNKKIPNSPPVANNKNPCSKAVVPSCDISKIDPKTLQSVGGLELLGILAEHTVPTPEKPAAKDGFGTATPPKVLGELTVDVTPAADAALSSPSPDINEVYNGPKSYHFENEDFSTGSASSGRHNSILRRSTSVNSDSDGCNTWTSNLSAVFKIGTGPDNMDAMELEMRMRLAELQRRYKEKQRELAKLTPKKDRESIARAVGRPRKRKMKKSTSGATSGKGGGGETGPATPKKSGASTPRTSTPVPGHEAANTPSKKKKTSSSSSSGGGSGSMVKDKEKENGNKTPAPVGNNKTSQSKPAVPTTPSKSKNNSTTPKATTTPKAASRNTATPSKSSSTAPKLAKGDQIRNVEKLFPNLAKASNPPTDKKPTPKKPTNTQSKTDVSAKQSHSKQITPSKQQTTPKKSTAKTPTQNKNSKSSAPEERKKNETVRKELPIKPEAIKEERLDISIKQEPTTGYSPWNSPSNSFDSFEQLAASNAGKEGLGMMSSPYTKTTTTHVQVMPTSVAAATSAALKSKKRKLEPSSSFERDDLHVHVGEVKKRKPTLPKLDVEEPTATNKPPGFGFLSDVHTCKLFGDQSTCPSSNSSSTSGRRSKSPTKVESRNSFYSDDWNRRRSERIFLSDSVSPNSTCSSVDKHEQTQPPRPAQRASPTGGEKITKEIPAATAPATPTKKTPIKTSLSKATSMALKDKSGKDRQKVKTVAQDLSQKVKKKYNKSPPSKSSKGPLASSTPVKKDKFEFESSESSSSESESDSSSDTEEEKTEDITPEPPRPKTPESMSCVLGKDDLVNEFRVLLFMEGLFYEGQIKEIQPPDVYGVLVDGERRNRTHIFSQEEILTDAIKDVKPPSVNHLCEGTRVCAYWSQQFSCLYPGTVAKGTPNPATDKHTAQEINVEFDDGDSGKIPLEHIRMLPSNFPIQDVDTNPIFVLGRRKSRTVSAVSEEVSTDTRDRKSSVSSPTKSVSHSNAKKTPVKPTKKKDDDDEDKKTVLSRSSKCSVISEKKKNNKPTTTNADNKTQETNSNKKKAPKTPSKTPSKKGKESQETASSSSSTKPPAGKKAKKSESNNEKARDRKESSEHDTSFGSVTSTCSEFVSGSPDANSADKQSLTLRIRTVSGATDPSHKSDTESDTDEDNSSDTESSSESQSDGSDTKDDSSSTESSSDEDSDEDRKRKRKRSSSNKKSSKSKASRRKRERSSSVGSKIAAFLPARQLWRWCGTSTRRPGMKGKARKEYYKSVQRGKELLRVGDCAVFLSTGRPNLPYVGRIESLWEAWGGNMVVRVKWFYHPEETKGGKKLVEMKGALYQSPHVDENDVQTISHKCEVISYTDWKKYRANRPPPVNNGKEENDDVYYLAGTYDPTIGMITFAADVKILT